jgi:hypothetical protein
MWNEDLLCYTTIYPVNSCWTIPLNPLKQEDLGKSVEILNRLLEEIHIDIDVTFYHTKDLQNIFIAISAFSKKIIEYFWKPEVINLEIRNIVR